MVVNITGLVQKEKSIIGKHSVVFYPLLEGRLTENQESDVDHLVWQKDIPSKYAPSWDEKIYILCRKPYYYGLF